MVKESTDVHVSFVGGLGNQLFQYANAIMLSEQGKILSTCISPKPSEKCLTPDLVSYASIELGEQRFFKNKFSVKLHNLILRNSSFENRHPNRKLTGKVLQKLTVIFLRFTLDSSPKIHFQTDLGFQPASRSIISRSILQIGYFQHTHWVDNSRVIDRLTRLGIENPSKRFEEISKDFFEKKILIIHMRFGDYLDEKLFGVPTVEYFRKSIDFQMGAITFDRVAVFTNGECNALKMLDDLELQNVMLISENEPISANETLELMRLGSAYILSNSTFGWWGAFLSRKESAFVICPTPWFQGMTEPNELIPKHWLRIPC
jgi:hypothetical protein